MNFHIGQVLSTPTISHAMSISPTFAKFLATSLERHQNIDSDVCGDDQELNRAAVIDGSRIFSSYKVGDDLQEIIDSEKVWIITEAKNNEGNRRCTTILLPSEY